jgi:subtilisin family serine protease
MGNSAGSPEVSIGLIDGPVDFSHSAFQGSNITTVKEHQLGICKNASSKACMHGTFVAGILCAKRDSSAPAICPGCKIILYPILPENNLCSINNDTDNTNISGITTNELSNAIIETIDAGAKIINLSLGLSTSSMIVYKELVEAYDYACQKGVIIVGAAGNQGNIGSTSLFNHPWIIPVAACDQYNRPAPQSNFGPLIGKHGLMAPGINITSTYPGGQYTKMSGTSFATPFVTGTIALLTSIFPKATATEVTFSVKGSGSDRRTSIIPPLLNAEQALLTLENTLY